MKLKYSVIAIIGAALFAVNALRPVAAQDNGPPTTQPDLRLALAALFAVEAPAKLYKDPELRRRSTFPSGSRVRLYFEPVNLTRKFVTNADGSKELQGIMVLDLEISDQAGKVVKSGKGVLRLPVAVKAQSPEEIREFDAGKLRMSRAYANVDFDPKLPAGAYTVKLRVNDSLCAVCSVEGSVQISIEPSAATQ